MAGELRVATGMTFLARPAHVLFRALWNRLPISLQSGLIYLGAPKVTMGVCAVIADAQGRLLLVHHTLRHRGWDLPGRCYTWTMRLLGGTSPFSTRYGSRASHATIWKRTGIAMSR